MRFSNVKQLYRLNKVTKTLEPDGEELLQEKMNAQREDTLDAILRKMLDAGIDPKVTYPIEVSSDEIIDDFTGDLFGLVSDYSDALDQAGIAERDPIKVITSILGKKTADQADQTADQADQTADQAGQTADQTADQAEA